MTNPPTPEPLPCPLPCPLCGEPGEWWSDMRKNATCSDRGCVMCGHRFPIADWNSLPRSPAWQPMGWVPTEPGWYWNRDPFEEPRKARMTLVGRSSRGLYVYGTFFPSNPLVEEWKRQWSNRIMEPVETLGKEGE